MSWLVVGVNTMVWPTKEIKFVYRGQKLLLRPRTEENAQSVVLLCKPPLTNEDGIVLIRRFFSALAWSNGCTVEETTVVVGSRPFQIGRGPLSYAGNTGFKPDNLTETDNPKALLALAFYREALNVNSIPYKFLGFFKIISILYASGKDQIGWIKSVLPKLDNQSARERVEELEIQGEKVANYLYVSGRCAVAHASTEPLIDPERPEDSIRLQRDLAVIQALSEYLIETELGIKSQRTIWREHLYELDGFRSLFTEAQLLAMKQKKEVPLGTVAPLPKLSVRLRDEEIISSLEALVPEIVAVKDGRVLLRCASSKNANIIVKLGLNFFAERIEFDPENIMELNDDGSVEVINAAIQRMRLLKGLVLNGQLEIWDYEENRLLGRTDPYIPVNIDPVVTLKNLEDLSMELQKVKDARAADRE